MKKFSSEYFEKKYNILFNKLLVKENFLNETKNFRKEIGLPADGFDNEIELTSFLIGKMDKEELYYFYFSTFFDYYLYKNKIKELNDGIYKEAYKTFKTELKSDKKKITTMAFAKLSEEILHHDQMLTKNHLFEKNKFLSKLHPKTIKVIKKFWGLDLLDEHIFAHLVEKYLFLGEYGVNRYIKGKVACPHCRYIGVSHFSPNRKNMEGQDDGPYSEKYIFNKSTVKLLSTNFNGVFLMIKPYATKEETIQYIEQNWNDLKEHIIEKNQFYKQYNVKPNKIKESNFEQNKLIYELCKLTKKEALKLYDGEENFSGVGNYKETIISAILKEKYNIDMEPEAIKKTAHRFAKHSKIINEPKDIGDI